MARHLFYHFLFDVTFIFVFVLLMYIVSGDHLFFNPWKRAILISDLLNYFPLIVNDTNISKIGKLCILFLNDISIIFVNATATLS